MNHQEVENFGLGMVLAVGEKPQAITDWWNEGGRIQSNLYPLSKMVICVPFLPWMSRSTGFGGACSFKGHPSHEALLNRSKTQWKGGGTDFALVKIHRMGSDLRSPLERICEFSLDLMDSTKLFCSIANGHATTWSRTKEAAACQAK